MEDVVMHYQSGSADRLSSLIEETENLLEPFPCRPPPVFRPWFSTTTDHRLPIRPAKLAPVITSGDLFSCDRPHTDTTVTKCLPENNRRKPEECHDHAHKERARAPPEITQERKERQVTRLSPEKVPQEDKDGVSPSKRSWSVFRQRGVLRQSSQSLSKQFHRMVSVHRLHLRQRAKWVINEHNCGVTRNMEQVWRSLSRSVQRLPTCNANIQRERAEIWVFCDVVYSEQVGRFLKDELQLSGRISLSVHRVGIVFSM